MSNFPFGHRNFQFCCGGEGFANEGPDNDMKCCIADKCNHIEPTCDTILCECDRNFTMVIRSEVLKYGCPDEEPGCDSSANPKLVSPLKYFGIASMVLLSLFNVR